MYAYERTNTPKLPWKPRSRPIDFGRSSSRSKRAAAVVALPRTIRGSIRYGAMRSDTAIGPAPGRRRRGAG